MDNMHVQFPETACLLLQLVVELMVDAIITQKKWLNEAFTTQKFAGTILINQCTKFEVGTHSCSCRFRNAFNTPKPSMKPVLKIK